MDTLKNEIVGIWNSDTGSWRAKFRKIQDKIAPVADEAPEAKAEDSALLAVDAMRNTIVSLKAEVEDLKAKLAGSADLRAQLDRTEVNYARLKQSLGLAAARNVVNVRAGEAKSPIDIYNSITDEADKTAFYQQHKDELSKLIFKP